MKNKRISMPIIVIALCFSMLAGCSKNSTHAEKQSDSQSNDQFQSQNEIHTIDNENPKVEISIEDAISIGMAEAQKYYDNLKLTEVHSYDNDHSPSIYAGENGKREWWYVNFANDKGNFVRILIVDGEIEEIYNVDEEGNNGLFDLSNIKFTSDEAVLKAKERGMRGGNPDNEEEWVSGFNFKLEYGSLIEVPNVEILILDVIGISPNGNFSRISFDATTGELLLAMEKFEYENGDVEWKPF